MDDQILIVKADGSREPFDAGKLEYSLRKAGAKDQEVQEVVESISSKLVDGMTTAEIYREAFDILKKKEIGMASRYSLRRALLQLGPTGFPFENFIAELFTVDGYETTTGNIVRGKCGEHELDLIASKGGKCLGAEIKFHNKPGVKTDLKVALYVHARFIDLIDEKAPESGTCDITKGLLITNTKFTINAVEYGVCAGLTMIGWNYPGTGNLQDLIEQAGIHPITCLTTLSEAQKRQLMENGILICRVLISNREALKSIGLSDEKVEAVLAEASVLCRRK